MEEKEFPKRHLLLLGRDLMEKFCKVNGLKVPVLATASEASQWRVEYCAYYRPETITICPPLCAAVGRAYRAWSYPGYVIDRTPYGVIQHELGHHVDYMSGAQKGRYWSEYSSKLRARTGENQITSYAPNSAEWFAEIFRLFVTNPDLLRLIRPRTFAALRSDWQPVQESDWRETLRSYDSALSQQRYEKAAANRFVKAH